MNDYNQVLKRLLDELTEKDQNIIIIRKVIAGYAVYICKEDTLIFDTYQHAYKYVKGYVAEKEPLAKVLPLVTVEY